MNTRAPKTRTDELLRKTFDATIGTPAQVGEPAAETIGQLRQRRGRRLDARRGVLRVVERNGVLYLEDATESARVGTSRRRSSRAFGLGGAVVHEVPFERLEKEKVGAALQALDTKLTPQQGLRELRKADGGLVACPKPKQAGRILLLVHGTFSNTENVLNGLRSTAEGKDLLARALAKRYQVLAFDHPTLSAHPMLNARELARCFEGCTADVDVVCHSRGGLVARWWVEALDRSAGGERRVVFVGSPLAGTGLAAPPNLRATLSLLTNVGRGLEAASGAAAVVAPFFQVASGLFQVFASVTNLMARTPAVDAAIALVPGLAAMSRVGNNLGIESLRGNTPAAGRYFAVSANFESEQVGWAFWKLFRDFGQRLADTAADAVFRGANDLVVDTTSMTDFGPNLSLPKAAVHAFGTTNRVHHTNYFEQKETVAFLAKTLGL